MGRHQPRLRVGMAWLDNPRYIVDFTCKWEINALMFHVTAAQHGLAQKRPLPSRFGLRLGRSIRNSSESIAKLLRTSGQLIEFAFLALPIILSGAFFSIWFARLQQVIHCSSD